jgi:TolB-like protein/Tfp pilus assembly protein PilF
LSSDPEQEYFADGLTEDLTTDLSQSPGTFIIARNTAFTYKGKAVNIQQVGRDLSVRYALEGSVRRTGDQIRINAQLIDTESGAHVWAERFDGDRANLGTLQNTVAARLARNISVEMIDAEAARGTREGSNNPDAVDLAMKGWSIFHRAFAREPLDQAQGLFDRAIQMDPSLVSGWIGLAYVHLRKSQSRMVPDLKEEHRKAYEASDRAISLAPRNATAHFLKASTLLSEGKTQAAAPLFEKALDLNPSLAPAHAGTGFLKILSGRSSEAPAHIEQALRLSPRDPSLHAWQYFMGRAYVHMAQDAKAAEWSERSISTNPNGSGIFAYLDLAASYAHLGRDADARAMVEEVRKRAPSYTVGSFRRSGFSSDPVWLKEAERFYEGLRKAGLPES